MQEIEGWYPDPLNKASVNTDQCCIPAFWITGGSVTRRPCSSNTWNTRLYFEVLFEAGVEICDTMCEANLSSAVAAFQTHKPPTTRQMHAGGEEGGTDEYSSPPPHPPPQPLSWPLSAIWQSGNLYDPLLLWWSPYCPPDSPSPSSTLVVAKTPTWGRGLTASCSVLTGTKWKRVLREGIVKGCSALQCLEF